MADPQLEQAVLSLTEPEIELCGLELVDLEILGGGGRLTLRFSLARPGGEGVSVEDCAKASRAIARVLDADAEELLRGRYVIEASSPGIFRALRRPQHFARSVGETVKLVLETEGESQQLRGELLSSDEHGFELRVGEATQRWEYTQVRKAHLDPPLDFGRAKGKPAGKDQSA